MDYQNIDINDFLCFNLYSTSRAMTKLYKKYLDPLDLSYPQFLVLLLLWKKDGQSVSDIGEQVLLDSGTLSPLFKRMEKRGLLKRVSDKQDERSKQLFLTKAGRDIQKQLGHLAPGMLCDIELSSKEVKNMAQMIAKVRHSIEKNQARAPLPLT